jgi:CubicO group peptidase (beta-lactamase class C family)
MKKALFALFLPVLFVKSGHSQDLKQQLDSLMSQQSADFLKDRSGVALSIGIKKGNQTFFYNYGTRDADKVKEPGINTLYEIGSLTKTFVNYVLANAVIEKRVKLDDDIRKYLEGSYPNLEYNGHPVTFRNLANTTSRFAEWLPVYPPSLEDSSFRVKLSFYQNKGKSDLYKALHEVQLDTVPGYWPRHSNAAAQLLVFLLEDIYRQPITTLVEKYVIRPAGMQHTKYNPQGGDIAKGYDGKGNLQPYLSTIAYYNGMAGLRSSTRDLIRYATFLMDSSREASRMVISPDLYVSAKTNKVIPYTYKGADPHVYSLGLGWFRYEPAPGMMQIFSDGNTLGFNGFLVMYPQSGSAIVLLSNHSDADTHEALPAMANKIAGLLKSAN